MTSQLNLLEIEPDSTLSTSSRLVRRANPLQVRDAAREMVTSVISGGNISVSFARLDQERVWRRTSEDCSLFSQEMPSEPFSGTWTTWGTAWDGAATELTKPLERPTNETASSSLDSWQTPGNRAVEWTKEDFWRTPSASDPEGGVMEIRPGCDAKLRLRDDAANWPTPASRDHKGKFSFPTHKGGEDLSTSTEGWPTPKVEEIRSSSGHGVRNLNEEAPSFPQAPQTSTPGPESLDTILDYYRLWPSKRRLNWRFVEWMMGFPPGWLG